MEKYIKPNMEIVEIPGYAINTYDTCPTKMPEVESIGGIGE